MNNLVLLALAFAVLVAFHHKKAEDQRKVEGSITESSLGDPQK